MESYVQEMKQLLQQYFLLLSGKRPMTGPLKTDEIIAATPGHGVKFTLPNTALEIVEHTITNWGLKVALGKFTDDQGWRYGAFSNGMWLLDIEDTGACSLLFADAIGSQYAYFEYDIGGDLQLYMTPGGAFRPYSGSNITLGTLVNKWANLFTDFVGFHLRPETSGSLDLGATHALPFLQYHWRNLFLSNTGYMATLDEISTGSGVEIPHAGDITLLDDKFLSIGKDSDATLPTPSAGYRGKMIRVEGGEGEADHAYVCRKLADETYEWTQLA